MCLCVCCVARMKEDALTKALLLFAVGLAIDVVPVTHICHNSNSSMNNEIQNSFSVARCYAETSAFRREKSSSKRQSIFTTLHGLILNMTSFIINNDVNAKISQNRHCLCTFLDFYFFAPIISLSFLHVISLETRCHGFNSAPF